MFKKNFWNFFCPRIFFYYNMCFRILLCVAPHRPNNYGQCSNFILARLGSRQQPPPPLTPPPPLHVNIGHPSNNRRNSNSSCDAPPPYDPTPVMAQTTIGVLLFLLCYFFESKSLYQYIYIYIPLKLDNQTRGYPLFFDTFLLNHLSQNNILIEKFPLIQNMFLSLFSYV